jgi:hypothetical protein
MDPCFCENDQWPPRVAQNIHSPTNLSNFLVTYYPTILAISIVFFITLPKEKGIFSSIVKNAKQLSFY